MNLLSMLSDRRQRIEEERQRELAELESQIRQQRLVDLAAAEERWRVACVEHERLKSELERDDAAQVVKELHRRWLDLVDAFDNRETVPPLRFRQNNPWDQPPAAELKRYGDALAAQEKRDQQMLEQIREADYAYQVAAMAQSARVLAFEEHPIHAKIQELRQRRDDAAAAIDQPV